MSVRFNLASGLEGIGYSNIIWRKWA